MSRLRSFLTAKTKQIQTKRRRNQKRMKMTRVPEAQDTAVGAGINFKAIITKPSGEKVVIQCAAFENIKVDGVRYIAADKEVKDTTLYSGPVFDYLDDELQDAFYSYLSDRKIDDDLAHFITSYAVEKEQNEYAIWLRQLAAFTSE
jgi:Mitochondrial glycoprotein